MDVKQSTDPVEYEVTTPKTATKYFISRKHARFPFYSITVDSGPMPKELKGSYTNPEMALRALRQYINKRKDSTSVRRDKVVKRREEQRNAKELSTDSADSVQQGSTD